MEHEGARGLVRRAALQNALQHSGKASERAVLSRVLSEHVELRPRARELAPLVKEVVGEVNSMGEEAQRRALSSEFPGAEAEPAEKGGRAEGRPEMGLQPLANVRGRVVMRFAPGPSGPLHIGHTRAAILNDEYARMYDGELILRVEDTDPDRVMAEAYEAIPEDLDWLGVRCTRTVIQSDRFELYYEHARRLLEMGAAYVCLCDPAEWRRLKEASSPCPHRGAPPEEGLRLWELMLERHFRTEGASLVVKTDLSHPDPAIRDFVGMRVVETPHPRTGDRYCVYPLMNFSVAIDDRTLGLTHVLRGKDHQKNTWRQAYIFRYFGWEPPEYIHYGRIAIEDFALSKSEIERGIRAGTYSGWDDVRLGTVRALARRGIRPEAIRRYWLEVGAKDVDIQFSWQNLYAHNRRLVDDSAGRFFFVPDPVPIWITGAPPLEGHAPVHPAHPERGVRRVSLGEAPSGAALKSFLSARPELPDALGGQVALVPREDLTGLGPGARLRLKDLCNIELGERFAARYIGDDLSILKEGTGIVQWAALSAVPCDVQMEDGSWRRGVVEAGARAAIGRLVQFERFGFVRLDRWDAGAGRLVGFFAHR
ncbi:MAG: glutamate--tRNA ligase [Thermoplasmatota archaeon]